ncbi:MAG: 50S ribosomal protein L16 [Candidatus Yanofskybacteria bacterium RIFCSPHIGHO2_01_FULL_45_42]|uniref:Large ribosomal subunit protein uL16 n=3 Tax=Candidatus Yanofskyibacteriota TaxID=1752733 RepID=A0A1F8F5D3_9BACT|nr:MAG: 50S ribosomal protein L16 [Candidatus Yanofskybacteria bacterium RIFCSPHIGHO2_01_FULL_45_42]OGN16341.1 MAG: 50S ribosomal protein L16 [Candidatus Yanofskybacteria bacterium RIFCSPHIGHO2_02_FULL_46_19]OGN27014.1 MAG: 50S ribosomal protein L16 [Candidatus Yanofskybacteria bacterium RIFCSPLOWO2_01_FULL_45_72]OGN32408.1 MAG: 50S ribosomal protein L16 [Candidatus Yanofskybacteria bacterium RIFCSPLOWO2_02_FULL_45_18]
MLQPSRVKHTKVHGGRLKETTLRGTTLSFGSFGLKALEASWLKASQLESARRAMTRFVQRGGKIWIRVFPDKPRTAKSSEVGMGGGRGALSHWVVPVESGRILFEIDGLPEDQAREALRLGAHKLPIKCRIISRN